MSMKLVFKIHVVKGFVNFVISPEIPSPPWQNVNMDMRNCLASLRSILECYS